MPRSTRTIPTALALVGTLIMAIGCAPTDTEDVQDPESAAEQPATYPEGPYVREGLFGAYDFPARVAVHHVERGRDRGVLRLTVEATGETDQSYIHRPAAFSRGLLGRNWAFSLTDPVGRKHYLPLLDSDDRTIGSPTPHGWVPGATYEFEIHFPPIPEGVERLTLHTTGDAGEFTGIPVVDRGEPSAPPSDSVRHSDVEPGDTVRPGPGDAEPAGDPDDRVHDLYSIVERPDRVRTGGADETTVGLHADVLFDLDESELTTEAEEVLREVAEETRAEADPSRPPITIVGHTDGQGAGDYNLTLSEERAEAVHAFLREELGTDYAYETEGRGDTEPVASENADTEEEVEEARAANRRVEISYHLLPENEREETDEEAGTTVTEGTEHVAAPPAPFREGDGEVVATGEATFLSDVARYRLHAYPMYRDGSYLVGVFELEHDDSGSGTVPHVVSPLSGDLRGGEMTAFSVSAPDGDDVLRAVRIGPSHPEDADPRYLSTRHFNPFPTDGESRRTFVYFPAPALGVDEVELDAGPFGTFTIPVE